MGDSQRRWTERARALPLPERVAVGRSPRLPGSVSSKLQRGRLPPRRVAVRVRSRWLLLSLLDRQAKKLLPRTQNGSVPEPSSSAGSHVFPKISRRRSLSENVRIKAYSVEMDGVQALNQGLSSHRPAPHKQVHRAGSGDTSRASPTDETQGDPEAQLGRAPSGRLCTWGLLSWSREERVTTGRPLRAPA